MSLRIALIGDYNESITAHRAISIALPQAADILHVKLEAEWLATPTITDESALGMYDAFWCTPGSPYKHMEGALLAIRHARENAKPFLGTCGGFQHAVIEYARNVLGWEDAQHAEESPDASLQVIAPLACSLVEVAQPIRFVRGSRIATIYDENEAVEEYHCRYGMNPKLAADLTAGRMIATAHDANGEVRAIELEGHRFFVATLFQPERGALAGARVPLVEALIAAAL
jgi:CTP synthase (UTP-ammonia lyase)